MPSSKPPARVDALVVGAGFAGLYALYCLRKRGFTAHLIEAADDVGGVWYWNRYPGARCDVPSLEYSYSFSEALETEWRWSERFAAQPEILAYLQHVAAHFELRKDISFSTNVVSARFDEGQQRWAVTTDRGDTVSAQHCIMATGSLSAERLPDLPGIAHFAGEVHHTGAWPHRDVDFTGKRVGVIGTGSSGVQAIPMVAAQAAALTVFQRTPNFVAPARNAPLAPDTLADWQQNFRSQRALAKRVGTLYEFSTTRATAVSADVRALEYQRRWDKGGVNFIHAFCDIMTDMAANDTAAAFVRDRICEAVTDPVVAAQLCPRDYPIGAKRICVGSGYYETFNRENVTLVNLRETPITGATADAIVTSAATIPLDVLICATGYDALTGALARIDIIGCNGTRLADKWAAGPRNYLGLMSAGFPNLYIITGPGSPSVLVNMVVGIEHHVEWIVDCIADLSAQNAATIVPIASDEIKWVQYVNDEADLTLFPLANSWYIGANIPGKPRVFLPFVGGIGRYRDICDRVVRAGYEGFEISPHNRAPEGT